MASSGSKANEETWWDRNTATVAMTTGVAFTFAIIAVAVYLYVGDNRIPATIDVLGLNLVGDSVSGFAAALAVVWLIVGAVMQRQELKITRAEAKLAREEFRESQQDNRDQFQAAQEVTQRQLAQLDQANKNQHEQALRDYKLSLFDKRIEIYNKLVALSDTMDRTQYYFAYQQEAADLELRSRFLFDMHVAKIIQEISVCYGMIAHYLAMLPTEESDAPLTESQVHAKDRLLVKQQELSNMLNGDFLFITFAKYLTVTDIAIEAEVAATLGNDIVVETGTVIDTP